MPEPNHITYSQTERRASDRFPIERAMRFKMLDARTISQEGSGQTVDISSGGIRFKTGERLNSGKRVEVAVSWPAQLNDTCRLKLVAMGRVVRSDSSYAAIAIDKYEFRTQGKTFDEANAAAKPVTG